MVFFRWISATPHLSLLVSHQPNSLISMALPTQSPAPTFPPRAPQISPGAYRPTTTLAVFIGFSSFFFCSATPPRPLSDPHQPPHAWFLMAFHIQRSAQPSSSAYPPPPPPSPPATNHMRRSLWWFTSRHQPGPPLQLTHHPPSLVSNHTPHVLFCRAIHI